MDGILRHAKNTIPSDPLTYLNQKTQEKWYYSLSTLRDIIDIFFYVIRIRNFPVLFFA